MSDRLSACAGRFFPADQKELIEMLDKYIDRSIPKQKAIGVMCPHAGYVYSGMVTGKCLSSVEIPDCVIIMCPNHTGYGMPFSVWPNGYWKLPIGDVPIDTEMVDLILSNSRLISIDNTAHLQEHACEVQVPFLYYLNPNVKIVPIVVRNTTVSQYMELGHSIAQAIDASHRQVLILASSDMTHYEPHAQATRKDRMALDYIEKLDVEGLENKLTEKHITMCGDAPVSVMMAAAKELGATHGEVLQYRTSGDACGDYSSVVGYAAVIVPSSQKCDVVKLASLTIETMVRENKTPEIPADPTMGGIEPAGCFVSIHKDGDLRGCIGTIQPTQSTIAEEIIRNAVSASMHDPRFQPVTSDELDKLEINVDILTKPERIDSEQDLDVKKYGCIVECGSRRGLLLPDLDGVNTVAQQIDICRRKGGIGPFEPITLYRFEVKRYK